MKSGLIKSNPKKIIAEKTVGGFFSTTQTALKATNDRGASDAIVQADAFPYQRFARRAAGFCALRRG